MHGKRRERQTARVLFVAFLALTLFVLAIPAVHRHEHPKDATECPVCFCVQALQALLRHLCVLLFTALPFLFGRLLSKSVTRAVYLAEHPTLITLKVRMNP